MQDCSLYLEKANLMQKICERGPQSRGLKENPRGNTAFDTAF